MGSYDLSKKPCCSKEDTQPEPPPPVKQSVEIEVMQKKTFRAANCIRGDYQLEETTFFLA